MNNYEWSFPVNVNEFDGIKTFTFDANEDERAALSVRAGVPAIHMLQASATVHPEKALGRYHVTGKLLARLDRVCVRTGETFVTDMNGDIEGFFADKEGTISFVKARKKRAEEFGDEPNFLDESEDPEPLEDGKIIDMGELAAQSFILALDPYPVSPDAPPPRYADEGDDVKIENPFAVLGQLRDFMGGDE